MASWSSFSLNGPSLGASRAWRLATRTEPERLAFDRDHCFDERRKLFVRDRGLVDLKPRCGDRNAQIMARVAFAVEAQSSPGHGPLPFPCGAQDISVVRNEPVCLQAAEGFGAAALTSSS